MARKTAEEGGLDAAAAQAERSMSDAALAGQQHGAMLQAHQQRGAQATVLSNGAIPEVKLGPVAGAPNVGDDADPRLADRSLLDPTAVAPIIGDATRRQPFRRAGSEAAKEAAAIAAGDPDVEGPRAEKFYAVLETKSVLDKTGGHRTPMRAGKIISDKHYDVVNLIRQGVRLKKVASPDGAGDESLIAMMTE